MFFDSWSRSLACVFVFLFLSAACQKKATNGLPVRYAVLRFENLSGDPALDWVGRALSASLPIALDGTVNGAFLSLAALERQSATVGPRPASAPGVSSERSQAILAGANRIITGYIERPGGQIRITATEEDVATGKTLRIVSATGASPVAAIDRLDHELSAHPRNLPTTNPEALRDWATALELPPAESENLLGQAVRLDPRFGPAWVSLASVELARGNRAGAEDVVERARNQKLDPLSQANLELGEANLRNDGAAKLAALRTLANLSPGDPSLRRSLAEAETVAGQFQAAASDWKKLTAASPGDSLAWNSLGYTLSYAGDYAGALAALREYQRLRPKDANPIDSIGDLNYSFRKFSEAAANYLEAHNKQPDFEQHGDLYKAAWAKFRAGDKQGADATFAQFRAARGSTGGAIELLDGDWLYRTGRQREAFALLRKFAAGANSMPARADAYAQLAIWDLVEGDRAQAAKDSAAIGGGATSAPVFMARFAAQPSASPDEWRMRAERMVPPSMTGLRELSLGYALILDGKRDAAIPVWEGIVKGSSATDFFSHAVYARLQGKSVERPLLPDPASLNQFQCILDKL